MAAWRELVNTPHESRILTDQRFYSQDIGHQDLKERHRQSEFVHFRASYTYHLVPLVSRDLTGFNKQSTCGDYSGYDQQGR